MGGSSVFSSPQHARPGAVVAPVERLLGDFRRFIFSESARVETVYARGSSQIKM
jgi:hypothetical protein